MRDADQVHLGRQLVGRMAPVAVGKDAQATRGKFLDLLLHLGKVGRGVLVPLRKGTGQFSRLLRVGLERVDDIDPVQRVQMIEVHDVIMNVQGTGHQVADQLGGGRHVDLECVLDGAHAGQGMNARTDAAEPFAHRPGIARIAAPEDLLDAAHHGA